MAELILTPPGLLSFPHLFTARSAAPGAEPRFSATLIFPAEQLTSPDYLALKKAVATVIDDTFGAGKSANAAFIKTLRMPFRDAGEKSYAGYDAGRIFISAWASEEKRPGVVDVNAQDIIDASMIYPGCCARFAVRPFAYNTSGNKGVSLGLTHVQILSSDKKLYPALDGSKSAKEVFGGAALPAGMTAAPTMAEDDEDLPF